MDPLTIVVSRLNKCVLRLSFIVKKQETCLQSSNPVIWSLKPACQSPSSPVVLLNIPDNINMQNPTNQHNFVKKFGCIEKVKHIVSCQNGLVVQMVDENSAVAPVTNSMKIWV